MFRIQLFIRKLALAALLISASYSAAYCQYDGGLADSLMNRSNIKGPLEFKGTVEELSRKLKGAIVTLYLSPDGSHENLTQLMRTSTPGNGDFEFKLEINKFYVLSVEMAGYTTKKVDFDTDVTLARENYTTVPKFEFAVDMVKDLDGLAFVRAVASVFYHLKTNTFNYQLDYSKEEMEDEEKELRLKQEQERLVQLAYDKKKELEEAAKLLLDKDNATAQEIIQAAVTVGAGDKAKTVNALKEVYSEVDTLRNKKADAMYAELLEERKRSTATGTKLNLQTVFDAGNRVQENIETEAQKVKDQQNSILRSEKEEAERKTKEAMVLAQKAIEIEAKEKLASSVAQEEAQKVKEEKDRVDKVYYAIFDSNGSSDVAIQNLIKTYPKTDPYKEQKAKAIFEEYEKTRLTGATLSKMDFNKLFNAADVAEKAAIQKEIADGNAKQNSKLDEFLRMVEEQKADEQKETGLKIEEALKDASADKAKKIAAIKNALSKNETYKDEKAKAIYEQYVQQKKAIETIENDLKTAGSDPNSQLAVFFNALPENTPDREGTAQRMFESYNASKQSQGGMGAISVDFGSLFKAAEAAEETARNEAKIQAVAEKQKAQDQLEARREDIRVEKQQLAAKSEKSTEQVRTAAMADAKSKKEKDLGEAIEKGAGDREATVQNIMKALTPTNDKELDRERAEAVFDAYLLESQNIQRSNSGNKVNYAALFSAAEQAELARLERQNEGKQLKEEERLAKYEEQRTSQAIEIAKVKQKEAEKEAEENAIVYEKTLYKTEALRTERLSEQKKQEEDMARQLAMEQEKRSVMEKERDQGELAVVEREKIKRLEAEKVKADQLAAAEAEQKRKEQELAEKEAKDQLALLEKQRKEAADAENRNLTEADAAKKAQALAEKKAEEDRIKAEQKLVADAENERKAKALADAKAADEAKRAEDKRLADLSAAQKAKELADAKAADEAKRAEEKRLADAENARKTQALADAKAADEAKRAEEKRLADLSAAQKAKELADAKAADEARKLEEEKQKELARKQAEQAEAQRKANYDLLIAEGDKAVAKKDFRRALENYSDAQDMYPQNKELAKKLLDTDVEVKRLNKEEAEQLALDQRYNTLMEEAKGELTNKKYDEAKAKFTKASELKPNEQEPKQNLKNIERTQEQLAVEQKQLLEKERKYVLLMQAGAKALEAGQLAEAKTKYEEARTLKPEESEPNSKLETISGLESDLAAAELQKQNRQKEAERKFAQTQEEERLRKEKEAEQIRIEQAARQEAISKIEATKAGQQKSAADFEADRIAKYDKLQESLKELDLNADEQRKAFLSELAKIYPEGLTQETISGKNFVSVRHVINRDNVVTIYEKKTWDWGGIFYFKDSNIAITEAIYKLEIGRYK